MYKCQGFNQIIAIVIQVQFGIFVPKYEVMYFSVGVAFFVDR
jgi:hypothetical protein